MDEAYEFPQNVLDEINSEPLLLSTLYDANLLPEQTCDDPMRRYATRLAVMAFMAGKSTCKQEPHHD